MCDWFVGGLVDCRTERVILPHTTDTTPQKATHFSALAHARKRSSRSGTGNAKGIACRSSVPRPPFSRMARCARRRSPSCMLHTSATQKARRDQRSKSRRRSWQKAFKRKCPKVPAVAEVWWCCSSRSIWAAKLTHPWKMRRSRRPIRRMRCGMGRGRPLQSSSSVRTSSWCCHVWIVLESCRMCLGPLPLLFPPKPKITWRRAASRARVDRKPRAEPQSLGVA